MTCSCRWWLPLAAGERACRERAQPQSSIFDGRAGARQRHAEAQADPALVREPVEPVRRAAPVGDVPVAAAADHADGTALGPARLLLPSRPVRPVPIRT